MSTHSMKAKCKRQSGSLIESYLRKLQVGHITFEICDHPKNGATFALIPGEA